MRCFENTTPEQINKERIDSGMLDIFQKLCTQLVEDMDEHVSGEKYELGTIRTITHEDLQEFDEKMNRLTRGKDYDICLFHPRRIRCDDDEHVYCRLTTVGSGSTMPFNPDSPCKVNYHICINLEDKEKII